VVATTAAIAFALAAGLRRSGPDSPRLRQMRSRHEQLHEELESVLRAEPLLADPVLEGGGVVVAIRTPYLGNMIREVARRYLDRVELDLTPRLRVQQSGDMKKKTPLGILTLGLWSVDLRIDRLAGVLGAEMPSLEVSTDDRVRLAMPVRLISATGAGVARFSWDSKNVATLVCKDFAVEETLAATAFPDRYRVRGGFAFFQQAGQIVAQPEFPHEKFRIRIDLTPEAWKKVEAAVVAQDTWERCGIALDPPAVLAKLREIAHAGFDFKLPRSLFRPIEMPAHYRSRVTVQGTDVDVAAQPQSVRLTSEYLSYAAILRARIVATPSPATASPTTTEPDRWHH
jgi:hypothetical protein